MFGSGMMDKLNAMKGLAEESKKRLDTISVEGEAGGGLMRLLGLVGGGVDFCMRLV